MMFALVSDKLMQPSSGVVVLTRSITLSLKVAIYREWIPRNMCVWRNLERVLQNV